MHSRLYAQRRRLALVFGFVFLWIWALMHLGGGEFNLILSGAVAAIAAGIIALVVVGSVVLIAPAARYMIELAVATVAPVVLLRFVWPSAYGTLYGGDLGPVLMLAQMLLTFRLIYGPTLDRLTARDTPVYRQVQSVQASRERIWQSLLPAPGHESVYFHPGTLFFDEDPEEKTWVAAMPQRDQGLSRMQKIRLLEIEPGIYFRYAFEPLHQTDAPFGERGWLSVSLRDLTGGRTEVVIEEQRRKAPLRDRIQLFLDDAGNDRMLSQAAHIEHKPDPSFVGLTMPKREHS